MQYTCKICRVVFNDKKSAKRKYCGLPCAYKSKDRSRNIPHRFSPKEHNIIKTAYALKPKTGFLTELSKKLGRTKPSIAAYAGKMGWTNGKRKRGEGHIKSMSVSRKKLLSKRPDILEKLQGGNKKMMDSGNHPKGMRGKSHSTKFKKNMSDRLKKEWKDPGSSLRSDEAVQKRADASSKRMVKRLKESPGSVYSHTKKGWREFGGGKRFFFRSKWEMNYAYYLEWLKQQGEIDDWMYEEDTFWFEKIRRGTRSYTPDFKITNNDGSIEYHEVKGYMDPKSKTKLKRMAKYYPDVDLKVIAKDEYYMLKSQVARMCNWE